MYLGRRALDLAENRHLPIGKRHSLTQIMEEAGVHIEEIEPRFSLPVAHSLIAGTHFHPKKSILHFVAKNLGPLD